MIHAGRGGNAYQWNVPGIVYFDLGQLDESVSAYQKAIELKPNFAQAYNNLGNAFIEKSQFNDAGDPIPGLDISLEPVTNTTTSGR